MRNSVYALQSFERNKPDMSFLKKHKIKIAAIVCIIAVLAVAFFIGDPNNESSFDNYAANKIGMESHSKNEYADIENVEAIEDDSESETEVQTTAENSANTTDTEYNDISDSDTDTCNSAVVPNYDAINSETIKEENIEYSKENGMNIDTKTGTDEYGTEPVPTGKPIPVEPEDTVVTDNELICTLSVRCDTAIGKSHGKDIVLPDDGIIFPEQSVVFYEGESVFNVLVREMKKNKIHLEFVNTPIYNSAYIEGICNLYEFDCGELSGWMYKVNDWYPNYGCSRYELKNGDKVEWIYTCDMGKDIGGDYSARNGM